MKRIWTMQDAENRFGEIVDRAMKDGPQLVTRRGRDAVVVVSATEFRKMTQPTESLLEFMQLSPLYGAEDIEFVRDKGRTRE